MQRVSLKSRAVAFAICAGAMAFILALLATSGGHWNADRTATALIPAIICAVMCWAAAERTIAAMATALDAAIERLSRAGTGDLQSPVPASVEHCVPELAGAMDGLFTQLHTNLENVQRLALFDPVTDLPNRINFRQNCERALAHLAPETGAALFFIDLDRFKHVNDTLGHATGDTLLGVVADRLRAVAARYAGRSGDAEPLLARLSGDEFTLFLPDVADGAAATRIGETILFAMNKPFEVADQEIVVGASLGIAIRPDHGMSLHDLMRSADAAMYRAKAGGRGRAELFSDHLATELADRVQLETELRAAIDKQQFALVFQPQVEAASGQMVAAEALVRWHHPDGLRMPASFLQRAEDTGLIVEIGDWVIANVASTIVRWAEAGVRQRLAINISRRQLDQADFFRRLREAMRAANAPAAMLELEITETLAMHCEPETVAAIAALRRDGATIAIDDFGAGYSNLARLRELPVDKVKLDHSLVRHVAEKAEARAIVQAVIALVHGMQCRVVAEGIETSAQAKVLRVTGCDMLQGFAVAEPMDEDSFLAWAGRPERAQRLTG